MTETTLSKYKKFAILGGILILIILGLAVYSILPRRQQPATRFQSTPSPIPYRGAQLPQPSGFEDELSKIKQILPYKKANYSIALLKPANIINIKINAVSKADFVNTKKQIEEFLKSKGVNNLCALNIFWISTNPQVRTPETRTSGCY